MRCLRNHCAFRSFITGRKLPISPNKDPVMSHRLCGPISSSQDGIVSDENNGSESEFGGSSEGLKDGGSDPPEGPTVEWDGKLGIPFMVAPELVFDDAFPTASVFK